MGYNTYVWNSYVAWVGANMTATSIVIFSVLRGFSQATGAVMQAIFSEEFDDEQVRATVPCSVPAAFSGPTMIIVAVFSPVEHYLSFLYVP